jgi:hypothetical protein
MMAYGGRGRAEVGRPPLVPRAESDDDRLMGNDITLFSGYTQKENRTTNYCLLVLKMLYEENPKFLGEVLSALIDEELADIVGVQFRQQTRKKTSVPDGLILQRPFTIYIETKNFDWFYDTQLEEHLAGLHAEGGGAKALMALGNFETLAEDRFARIEAVCADRYQGSIYFAAASFEDFLDALPRTKVSKNLADTIDDFEGYLDEVGLLPRWKYRLDVVNCGRTHSEIARENVYICPAKGGAYNHSRSNFFGVYHGKTVRHVAAVEAVVDMGDGDPTLRWKNVETPDSELLARAREKRDRLRPGGDPIRVFLLGPLRETDFRKPTKGGMQTSKRYFDVERVHAVDAADLAERLRGKTWKDY